MPLEDVHAEFFLEETDLFAYARLRGVEGLRGSGHVESLLGDFNRKA
jgi:hypothetical protein